MKKVLVVFGTRPEIIKMAPVVYVLREEFEVTVCLTAQHREMADQALEIFQIKPDKDLNIMSSAQGVSDVTSLVLLGMTTTLREVRPDIVLVQGDTTTTMASALAAYYQKICIGHIEAGLRTHNQFSPFPEEVNRQIVSRLATYHFAPTESAARNLGAEGINSNNVLITGNTVVDALELIQPKIKAFSIPTPLQNWLLREKERPVRDKRLVLVTIHRRESFGEGLERVCRALKAIAQFYPTVDIVFPVHPNPEVQEPTHKILRSMDNVFLSDPLDYPCLLKLIGMCEIVVTDSGGLQEEAPSFGKPVVVLREHTERMEAVTAKQATLVGTSEKKIVQVLRDLIDEPVVHRPSGTVINPFGDGKARFRIRDFLRRRLV